MTVELSQEQKDQLVGGGECFLHSHTPDQITGLVELVLQEVPEPEPPGTYLESANNLSDVASIISTLTNLGLDQVDNTSDLAKPVSTATSAALSGKADTVHSHVISNVTGLQTALDGKAASSHTHTIANVTGLQAALDLKLGKTETALRASQIGEVANHGGVSFNAVAGTTYLVWASGITATLPASPAIGDTIYFCVHIGIGNWTIARNGKYIMGLAENMTVDKDGIVFGLRFIEDSSGVGWRIV